MTALAPLQLERLSLSRPGYELLDITNFALPYFVIRAEVLLIDRRPLGPIEEFVMKAINSGWTTVKEIGGIFGLNEKLVVNALVGLQRKDCVDQIVVGDRSRDLRLTARGALVLESEHSENPSKEEVKLHFNRLRWTIEAPTHEDLLKPKDIADAGLREIPLEYKKKPAAEDLRLDTLQESIRRSRRNSKGISVLVVNQILKTERFYLPVEVAVFRALEGHDSQVAVLIDGRLSESNEEVIERCGGVEFLGGTLGPAGPPPLEALVADYGRPEAEELAKQAPPKAERHEERRQRMVDSQIREQAQVDATPIAQPRPPAPRYTTSSVQFIDTFEHREFLNLALSETRTRLVIISPWIASSVVNKGFLERLDQLLRKKVRVHIGYGLDLRPGDRRVSAADKHAENALVKMAAKYDKFTLVRLGNTHSKQLLFDDVHISGSFNWLSFQGVKGKEYRHEESTVIRIKNKVDDKYIDLLRRIETASRSE